MKHIVIAGGGFAGLHLARKLRKQKDMMITVINPSADFRYSPALYRAVVGFKIGIARLPIEWALLDCSNSTLKLASVTSVDPANKTLTTDTNELISYDYAIFSLGSKTSYFGIKGLPEFSYGIKTVDEVVALRKHIHDTLSVKSNEPHNYVIVGAGPTGVELAGSIGSYLKHITKLHHVSSVNAQVHLVEAGPRILSQMSNRAANKVAKNLSKLGVIVHTGTQVQAETLNTLRTSIGSIKTNTVIWTAGTQNNEFFSNNKSVFSFDKRGKVVVDKHLCVTPTLYVCGDNASTKFSGLALTAVWHADFIAKDIVARIHHKNRPTKYERAPAQVVPAGRAWAVFQYRGIVMSGRLPSVIRRVADFVGYRDIVGTLKALTIWSNGDTTEEVCNTCRR